MKTLFLHIGTPKTATSSIQRFCAKNRNVLQSKGYCYPRAIRDYYAISRNRNAHFMIGNIRCEGDDSVPNAKERRVFEEGMENIHSCFERFDNVVMSDEGLWLASGPTRTRPNLWKDLKEDADKHGYTVKTIVYLRRQDQFLSSRYNQRVKNSGFTQTWDEHVETAEEVLGDMLDYASKINSMTEVFGKENVCVRRFDRNEFYGGSIYTDFFQFLGLEITDEYKALEVDANLAFGGNTFEIMRVINEIPDFGRANRAYMRHLVKQCAGESGNRYKHTMFSKEEAQEFIERYRQGNEQIAADYIGDGRALFDYEVKDTEKWQKQNDYMIDDLIQLFAITTCELHEEIARLKQQNVKISLFQRLKNFIRRTFRNV